jgi:hypothetical protein
MHLDTLLPLFPPLIKTVVCVPRPSSPHAALAATRNHVRRSYSGLAAMEFGSECDNVSSGSETSRIVKSVRGDEVATDSTSDLDSLFEDDGRSVAERDDLLQRMAFHKSQGRARSRRKAWSQSLVEREVDFWRQCVYPHSIPAMLLPILTCCPLIASVAESARSTWSACRPARLRR